MRRWRGTAAAVAAAAKRRRLPACGTLSCLTATGALGLAVDRVCQSRL